MQTTDRGPSCVQPPGAHRGSKARTSLKGLPSLTQRALLRDLAGASTRLSAASPPEQTCLQCSFPSPPSRRGFQFSPLPAERIWATRLLQDGPAGPGVPLTCPINDNRANKI